MVLLAFAKNKVYELRFYENKNFSLRNQYFSIVQECLHPTVMKNMCADCGLDLEKDMPVSGLAAIRAGGPGGATSRGPRGSGGRSAVDGSSASIAVLHSIPELKVSKTNKNLQNQIHSHILFIHAFPHTVI